MHIRRLILIVITITAILATTSLAGNSQDKQNARRSPVVEVFNQSRDAVVNISSTEIITQRSYGGFDWFEDFFDLPRSPRTRQYTRHSVGSGFVIHSDGYIVTNAHVVARTTERKIMFADGSEYDAELIAIDTERDLAVLKVVAENPLPILPLGRSDDLMIGETVIAIGNPLGYQHTVTAGVISAAERELQVTRELTLKGLVQTDASINPGNSGGPLLNVLGELIGINTAIRGDAQNIGFAIPVDHLREILPDLLDVERRQRIVTGLEVDYFNEPRVISVQPNSPADRAGVRAGDVLTTVNQREIQKGVDFDIALIGHDAGDVLDLRLRRADKIKRVSFRLEPRPAPNGAQLAEDRLGLEVYPLPEDVARELGLRQTTGLIVDRVEPGGPADELGILRRDILLSVGRHYVSSLDDLGQLLEYLDRGQAVSVSILRVDRRGKMKLSGTLETR